ncbi:hypothetical protein BV898_04914 [Hypsibius exemplaris]|uniref:Uncharacterized protein n=1 Tax=Hypsibius exemplaris TaxID=2072580 RepID=A0A1W0X139_HYPEX|nr:hypothetical protein BV898_04914 [Hypsibius exemplaris]
MSSYRDEEADPGFDDVDHDPNTLVADLVSSRKVLHVAEYAGKTFEENLHHSTDHHAREFGDLVARKDLAEKAIRACLTSRNEFLRDMFVRFGRTENEALAFQKSTLDTVKAILRRRILLKKRGIDATKYRRNLTNKVLRKNHFQWQEVMRILEDKKASGDIMFQTNIPNAYLKRVARHTRQLLQGITSTLTYDDLIQDLGGKFRRILEYMHDDEVVFSRNIDDLKDRIKHQEKEISYLEHVHHESTHAVERAEKMYWMSAGSYTQSELVRANMMEEIGQVLQDHQDICTKCTEQLVELNEKFYKTSDGCMNVCTEMVRRYPSAMHSIKNPQTCHSPNMESTTELTRTFQILLALTRARDPEETVKVFYGQVQQATHLQAQVDRLEHLLKTVLRPEFSMFEQEHETNEATVLTRAVAAEKAIRDLQDSFDLKVEEARVLINTQRDNAQEFENFAEALFAINDRIGHTFGRATWSPQQIGETTSDQSVRQLNSRQQSVAELVDATGKNLRFIADKMTNLFRMPWPKLQLLVEDSQFLEYRGSKIPAVNNRTTFDTATELMSTEKMRDPLPTPHPRFLTNAHFKNANQQIVERARLEELARLNKARKEAEKEEHHDAAPEPPKKKDKAKGKK